MITIFLILCILIGALGVLHIEHTYQRGVRRIHVARAKYTTAKLSGRKA